MNLRQLINKIFIFALANLKEAHQDRMKFQSPTWRCSSEPWNAELPPRPRALSVRPQMHLFPADGWSSPRCVRLRSALSSGLLRRASLIPAEGVLHGNHGNETPPRKQLPALLLACWFPWRPVFNHAGAASQWGWLHDKPSKPWLF